MQTLTHHRYTQLTFRLLLATYIVLICYLSLMPVSQQLPVHIWDKAAHTLAYCGFISLAVFACQHRRMLMHCTAGFFVFGIVIEIAQGLTGYRSFSWLDMLANTLGLAVGLGVFALINTLIPLPGFSSFPK